MAQNVKAADLIGKTIVVGNNQGKIIVKSVQDNGMLACEFSKAGEDATTPMSVTLPNLQKMTERGLWKISETESATVVGGVVVAVSEHHDITTEADVAEVEDIVPVVTKNPITTAEEPKKEKPVAKVEPISKPKQEKPKAKTQPSGKAASEREQNGARTSSAEREQARGNSRKYVYSTYQTSKGKTGAKITGVSETDAAYQQAAAIHASGSYTKDKDGNKHFYLCFGPRYAEAAKKVCELLNAGKPIEDAIAVVNAATEERAVKREEARVKREERKAQKPATKSAAAPAMSADEAAMFDLFKKFMAGDKEAMAKVNAVLNKAA